MNDYNHAKYMDIMTPFHRCYCCEVAFHDNCNVTGAPKDAKNICSRPWATSIALFDVRGVNTQNLVK